MKEKQILRTFVNGKIHQLKVTGLQPDYNGSYLICTDLLAAAGIEPLEKVEIYSLTRTARIATYVFPGAAEG
jgi:aspartate 1-decarboxylase